MKPVAGEFIEKLFKAAWPNEVRHPSLRACQVVAGALNVIAASHKAKPESTGQGPQPRTDIGKAGHHALKFLENLPNARIEVERQIYPLTEPIDEWPEFWVNRDLGLRDKLAAMDEAEKAIRKLLLLSKPVRYERRNPVKYTQEKVLVAWRNTGIEPHNPLHVEAPMVIFIVRALAEINMNKSAATVCGELKGQRYRPR